MIMINFLLNELEYYIEKVKKEIRIDASKKSSNVPYSFSLKLIITTILDIIL